VDPQRRFKTVIALDRRLVLVIMFLECLWDGSSDREVVQLGIFWAVPGQIKHKLSNDCLRPPYVCLKDSRNHNNGLYLLGKTRVVEPRLSRSSGTFALFGEPPICTVLGSDSCRTPSRTCQP
jgi:hypothetical protein